MLNDARASDSGCILGPIKGPPTPTTVPARPARPFRTEGLGRPPFSCGDWAGWSYFRKPEARQAGKAASGPNARDPDTSLLGPGPVSSLDGRQDPGLRPPTGIFPRPDLGHCPTLPAPPRTKCYFSGAKVSTELLRRDLLETETHLILRQSSADVSVSLRERTQDKSPCCRGRGVLHGYPLRYSPPTRPMTEETGNSTEGTRCA